MATKQHLMRAFRDAATHPATLLSLGNIAAAWSTRNYWGMAAQTLMTGPIARAAFKAALAGKPPDLPYYLLGTGNLVTAGLGFGWYSDTTSHLLTNVATAGWGVGHFFSGYDVRTRVQRGNNMIVYGLADMSAVGANPAAALPPPAPLAMSAGLAVAGFLKTVFDKVAKPAKEGSLRWHVTPARLYGSGYILSGLLSLAATPAFGVASLLWGVAEWGFDPKQNFALRQKIKGLLPRRKKPEQKTI